MTVQERVGRSSRRLRQLIRTRRLETALAVFISATIVLTVVSLTIYKVGGFYRYDLSRPGYEKERAELATFPNNVTLDTTGPINKTTVGEVMTDLDVHRQNLEAYNTFASGGLTDEDLQLLPPSTP